MEQPEPSGSVRLQDYEHPDYLKRLEPVARRYMEDNTGVPLGTKSLGQLIGQLAQFMEDALGKNALPPKPFPKLPASLLRNYSPEGPLYVIAQVCGQHMKAKNLKKIDFLTPARRKENLELLGNIRQELQRERMLPQRRVFLHPALGADLARLAGIVRKMGADLAPAEDAPGVTHVVHPFGPDGDPDDGQQYMRTLEQGSGRALVHWWYRPDSYDEWVSADVAPADVDTPHKMPGPVHVYLRWLYDSEAFNEWANPADYETEGYSKKLEAWEAERRARQGGDASHRVDEEDEEDGEEGGVKRRRSGEEGGEMEGGSAKKARSEVSAGGLEDEEGGEKSGPPTAIKGPRPEVDLQAAQQVAEGVTKQVVLEPHKPAMDSSAPAEDISQGQHPPGAPPIVPRAPSPPPAQQRQDGGEGGGGGGAEVPAALAVPAEAPKDAAPAPAPPRALYRVPAHASWFEWDSIHDLERRHLPEFFSGKFASKTPEVYREYRNFMINLYREDTGRYLTFTDCRKRLVGDVNGILRVWRFLDHWGLINFTAPRPSGGGQQAVEVHPAGTEGAGAASPVGALSALPAPPNTDALFRFQPPSTAAAGVAFSTGGVSTARLVTRRDAHGRSAAEAPGGIGASGGSAVSGGQGQQKGAPRFFCNAMPWRDCTERRYHCTKVPDIDLCPQAFAEGRFPPGCTANDFVLIDARQQQEGSRDGSGWSDQETLLLLEGLELYGDRWAEVAEHVGTKSQLQCVTHFLQLPIEDGIVDAMSGGLPGVPGPLPPGESAAAAAEAEAAAGAGEAAAQGQGQGGQRSLQNEMDDELIPFADAGNPVMAQLAFLSCMVGPRVAAAAAQRALEVLEETDPATQAELAAEAAALKAAEELEEAKEKQAERERAAKEKEAERERAATAEKEKERAATAEAAANKEEAKEEEEEKKGKDEAKEDRGVKEAAEAGEEGEPVADDGGDGDKESGGSKEQGERPKVQEEGEAATAADAATGEEGGRPAAEAGQAGGSKPGEESGEDASEMEVDTTEAAKQQQQQQPGITADGSSLPPAAGGGAAAAAPTAAAPASAAAPAAAAAVAAAAPLGDGPISAARMKVAAATAMAAAAVKAKLLADAEERSMRRLMADIVEVQLQKVAMKMRYVDQVEESLERERANMEIARQTLMREMLIVAQNRAALAPMQGGILQQQQPMMMMPAAQQVAMAPPMQPGAGAVQQQQPMQQQQPIGGGISFQLQRSAAPPQ